MPLSPAMPPHFPLRHSHGNEDTVVKHRVGGWLPRNHLPRNWLENDIVFVEHPSRLNEALHPVIQEFQSFIETNPTVYMYCHQMFEQVPNKPPYNKDPTGKPQVRDYKLMLRLFNNIIESAPRYEDNAFVGFPINAILEWPMGTPAGVAFFSIPQVNVHFKNMLDVWSAYLTSEASCTVLDDAVDGWFGPAASAAFPNFEQTYTCDPSAPFHGFRSWDDFFTRQFRPNVRPVLFADNDNIINSACESTVYCIAYHVKKMDRFWLKGQPYSLAHMFDDDEAAVQFAGGTVYQAFLSATKYHRWHAPVNGRVVRIVTVPGTYYAESPSEGFPDPDPVGQTLSQAFITAVATRTIIFIEADNLTIGLMAFIAVGMAEVSTCEATVKAGDVVRKGDQLGMFHFGGSTHCLVFRPQVKVTFYPEISIEKDVNVNAPIAMISTA